jgi:glycerol-3-phosphate acyltransferase PlsY
VKSFVAQRCEQQSICYASAMDSATILALVAGYLLGSIPFGLLLTRFAGKGDIREIGSGNIGATNVLRTGSKGLAAATLVLDAVKGAAAVLIAQRLWPDAVNFAAAGALIGHLYPAWLRFKGGKGVATMLGILVPLFWQAAVVYAVLWVGLLLVLRISSLSGMAAAASAPVTAALLGEEALFPMLLGFALLVIWKHRENIRRLSCGEEPRVGRKA